MSGTLQVLELDPWKSVDAVAEERNYLRTPSTEVLTVPAEAIATTLDVKDSTRSETLSFREWCTAVDSIRSSDRTIGPPDTWLGVLKVPQLFLAWSRDGHQRVGVVRCAFAEGLVGVFNMAVHPAHRRGGIARALMAKVAAWAVDQRAEALYLQVEQDNKSARALYLSMGFEPAYKYHYQVSR